MMRIAISAEENNGLDSVVSHHFGRCPYYILIELEDEEIQGMNVVDNPYFLQHQPGMVPAFIQSKGVDVMVSGGMGRRAINFFEQYGIQVATGATGTVRTTLERFLNGELQGASPCREHAGKDDCHE